MILSLLEVVREMEVDKQVNEEVDLDIGPARRSLGRVANVLKLPKETADGKNLYSRNTQLDPHLRP